MKMLLLGQLMDVLRVLQCVCGSQIIIIRKSDHLKMVLVIKLHWVLTGFSLAIIQSHSPFLQLSAFSFWVWKTKAARVHLRFYTGTRERAPVSYHVTGLEDPVEGKVPVGLVKSPGDALAARVIQGSPLHLTKARKPLPLQPLHPQLLTCRHSDL